jgi:hypothetical protein
MRWFSFGVYLGTWRKVWESVRVARGIPEDRRSEDMLDAITGTRERTNKLMDRRDFSSAERKVPSGQRRASVLSNVVSINLIIQ